VIPESFRDGEAATIFLSEILVGERTKKSPSLGSSSLSTRHFQIQTLQAPKQNPIRIRAWWGEVCDAGYCRRAEMTYFLQPTTMGPSPPCDLYSSRASAIINLQVRWLQSRPNLSL
jgi:hypothetical protein